MLFMRDASLCGGSVDEMTFVWFMKLFLDLRGESCGVSPYIGYRGSDVFVLS